MAGTSFTMQGAREVLEMSRGAIAVERQVIALENSIVDNPSLAFDLARSLIESVCITILNDHKQKSEGLGFKDLLKRTYEQIQLVPSSYLSKPEIAASIQKMIDGFEAVIQGLTDLRMSEGIASHGKDVYAEQLESTQARLAAQSADTMIHYLYMAHINYQVPALARKLQYEDNPDFNGFVDDRHDLINIFEYSYQPSEVLFNMDEEAYRSLLSEYTSKGKDE